MFTRRIPSEDFKEVSYAAMLDAHDVDREQPRTLINLTTIRIAR